MRPLTLFGRGGQRGPSVSALERQIDELVYKLYRLTAEEIKIVEGEASD